jgi:hypothetical protein
MTKNTDNAEKDNLDLWMTFVKCLFLMKVFRKIKEIRQDDNIKDEELKQLLEYVINMYGVNEGYKNDLRYLKLWCTYADISEDPHFIFSHMQQQNIGQDYALFYECWAMVLETLDDYAGAMEVYQQGLKRCNSYFLKQIYTYIYAEKLYPLGV